MSKKTELAGGPAAAGLRTTIAQGAKTTISFPDGTGPDDAATTLPPVVGWLVVTDGPGKGRSREITFGMNSIGRGDDNAVVLDFGDTEISGSNHFRIAYDDLNRQFLISAGDGRNLVYIDGRPVMGAQELTSPTDIKVGATALRFVALCGADWSWSA